MKNKLLEQIRYYIYSSHVSEAKSYQVNDIKLTGSHEFRTVTDYEFKVKDHASNRYVTVGVSMIGDNIRAFRCNCSNYQSQNSCCHIPAVMLYAPEFSRFQVTNQSITKMILNDFASDKKIIKKLVKVDYYLDPGDYRYDLGVKLKVGYDRLYTVGSKYYSFLNVYEDNKGEVKFGKNFTYNPKEYYFSDDDKEILEYIFDNGEFSYDRVGLTPSESLRLLKLLENKNFYLENVGLIANIKDYFPLNIQLTKENDIYKLNVNIDNIEPITRNYEYILYQDKVYHLNKGYQKLLDLLINNEVNTLEFSKEELAAFNSGLLPVIKNELKMSQELKDILAFNKPSVKLYFDINLDMILCTFKLQYNQEEINYFDDTKEIFRDMDYESEVINDLASYYFSVDNNKIILNDLELVVNFLENGLNELATKYEIFTSEKLKSTNIRKKVNVNSNFSIGEDNIMHYSFTIDDINNAEINNLIKSLRQNKKYYKLQNGDIVSLEDNSINELSNLLNDLDIDAKNNEGVIPKYQAIYLDYLKKKKYPNIKTNKLFDNFINNFNEYKDGTLNFKEDEKKLLRSYQIEGVEWLYNIHKCDLGGILADEMGLGKTIQSIYFFRKLHEEDQNSRFLVVCPTSLCYNWLKEFEMYDRTLNVAVLTGNKDNRIKKINNDDIEVYITSYGTLREDLTLYNDKHFKVCLIDEAQNIKNPHSLISRAVKRINADTKIALTGTPLENSILELWSIFDFIMPGYLNTSAKFNEKYHFKEMNDDSNKIINNLKDITSPFILRRKKNDVVKELPDKIENDIFIDLDETQKQIYALEVKEVKEQIEKLLEAGNFNSKRVEILTLLTRLRQICIDPKLVYENYEGTSAKIVELVKIVEENISNGHKMLLFTSFKKAFDIVQTEFNKHNITYYQIDGSVKGKTRQELVDKFNNDDTNVFLITLKSGGTGLNLTSADIVIHLDLWWNPQVENQATDRAHRIGQTKKVEVIKLIANGTIEERILELQKKKSLLADKLIEKGESGNISLSSLTENDIKRLIDC